MQKLAGIMLLGCMSVGAAQAADLSFQNAQGNIEVVPGKPTFVHKLHYRKLYDEKPFPDAVIYYYSNGVYKILSQGENHYGLYVIQGSVEDQSYTIRYISAPSKDWGNKTAFHQLTFVNGAQAKVFIQNAITDTGEQIAQQNGEFLLQDHDPAHAAADRWDDDLKIKR
ncbi:hypothetical protein [Pantoea sp. Pa-EAmG]|uniref:hypothetical protein n=1 Tax=Pantoea sp. Pa-EAmG TaxID=3043311 RepID=UPI0024AEC2CD|nr:hypothetical protein [Pantoea sp. Pa-EAmG]MDI6956410.1 hypothetical protein [Pantoea sp. Pa-EAmG]